MAAHGHYPGGIEAGFSGCTNVAAHLKFRPVGRFGGASAIFALHCLRSVFRPVNPR